MQRDTTGDHPFTMPDGRYLLLEITPADEGTGSGKIALHTALSVREQCPDFLIKLLAAVITHCGDIIQLNVSRGDISEDDARAIVLSALARTSETPLERYRHP
jgi:hypothetical protein